MKVTAASADIVRRPAAGFVVLIYHRVGERTRLDVDLPRDLFEEQIAYIAAHCDVVTLADGVSRVTRGYSAPTVAVTFDDGTADFADEALPVLVRHRVPATLYVATEFVDRGRLFPDDGVPLSWAALRDAHATGLVDVGSHTHTHALLDRLASDRIAGELDRSVDLIGEHVGARAEHFAYPKAVPGSADGRRRRARTVRLGRARGVSREPARAGPRGGSRGRRCRRATACTASGERWTAAWASRTRCGRP